MASEKNPVEEFFALKKTAGPMWEGAKKGIQSAIGEGGSSLGESAGRGAMMAAGAGAVAGAGIAAQKLYDAATKGRDFRAMLEYNPQLVEKHQSNPKLFNQMFSTLRTFNPSFSRDPLVSGQFMEQMFDNPQNVGHIIQSAMSTQGQPHPVEAVTRAATSKHTSGKR